MKSEPTVYSWGQLAKDKRTAWSGVRNHQANNNMKAMQIGDEAFFYHSGDERAIVGILRIVKVWYLDPSDSTGVFGMVDVAPVYALPTLITLATIKENRLLREMVFVRQSRLSVSPVMAKSWDIIVKIGNLTDLH